jgi:sugar lactone lactonase YvrE
MKYRSASLMVILLMAFGLLGSLVRLPTTTNATTTQATTVVASGLNSPRGMAFGPDNALYVTEAGTGGSGPCITASSEREVCYGPTGAVTRVDVDAATQQPFLTELPSLLSGDGTEATGPHDIALFPDGSGYLVTGLGAPPERRDELGDAGEGFAQFARITPDGQVVNVTDLADYEQSANPDGSLIDTNPYALVALPEWQVVADAGANALLEIDREGNVFRATSFPTRTVDTPPPPPDLPPQLPMESVPDAVAVGPDGAYYVGELTGFPFPVDGARVYRLVPGQTPEVYAEGFTNIIDLTFDAEGNLYVLEIAANGLLQAMGPGGDFTGGLVQVNPDDNKTKTIIASDVLTAPTSLAISPAGGIYVANSGIMSGTGEILRLDQCDPDDPLCREPVALPPPLTVTLTGEAEVDADGTPGQGDADGSGRAIITLDDDASTVCVQATVAEIAQPTAAHIHEGNAGVNGPPVVGFTDLISGTLISGCVEAEPTLIETMRNNPAAYYLNVHNDEFPAGAVRGQLADHEIGAIPDGRMLYLPYIAQ